MLLLFVLWTFRLLLPLCTLKVYSSIMYHLFQAKCIHNLCFPYPFHLYNWPTTTNCIPEHGFSLSCVFVCIISWSHSQSLSMSYIPDHRLIFPSVSCIALLLLLCHCPSHFHLYNVCIFSDVATLLRLLDPENGGIMLLMLVTIYQLMWHVTCIFMFYAVSPDSVPHLCPLSMP